jgi:predicted methyltransferase
MDDLEIDLTRLTDEELVKLNIWCRKERHRQDNKRRYLENADQIKLKSNAYYHAHKEHKEAYYHANKEHIAERRRSQRYNLTPEDYAAMYAAINGCCTICGIPQDVLAVDHDHKTTKVRGLLCKGCNLGLGGFKDDTELLAKAIVYLSNSEVVEIG